MSTLTITGIQSTLHWEDKKANLQMFEEKIFSISQPTEIVVLPEMFSTGFSMQPEKLAETMEGETMQWMKQVAAKKKIILTGSLIIKDSPPPLHEERSWPAASLRRPQGVRPITIAWFGCCQPGRLDTMTNGIYLLTQMKISITLRAKKD